MLVALEAKGRELAKRHEQMQLQKLQLGELPQHIASLEATIDELKTLHPSPKKSENPSLNLSLQDTTLLLAERESELASLDSALSVLQSLIPRKTRELDRLEAELQPLQNQKKFAVTQAKEARKRREEGGVDELEQKGRWYKASHAALVKALGVES
jgi:chromosome segregation ATPase